MAAWRRLCWEALDVDQASSARAADRAQAIRASAALRYRAPGYPPRRVPSRRTATRRTGPACPSHRVIKVTSGRQRRAMKVATLRSQGSRVPPERISHTVWLYHRFCVSVQKTDDLLAPRGITDTLRRDAAAHRTVMSSVPHSTRQYDHTRAAVSHQSTRHHERPMRRLSSVAQAPRLSHGAGARAASASRGAPPTASRPPSPAPNTRVPPLARGDVCLLSADRARSIAGSSRQLLVNLNSARRDAVDPTRRAVRRKRARMRSCAGEKMLLNSGGTGSGKTTLLNTLIEVLPAESLR